MPDSGGWRVDTGSADERCRYVFTDSGPALTRLAATITDPRVFIKLCADADTLLAALPAGWAIADANCMMVLDGENPPAALPPGYRVACRAVHGVTHATIVDAAGELAGSGHAAERDGIFTYDRIVTTEPHRRRGLGRVLMATLGAARRDPDARQVLTATEMGAALYATLGWRIYAPWTTARRASEPDDGLSPPPAP